MRTAAVAIALLAGFIDAHAFDSGRAGFSIRVNDLVIPYRIFAVYALPGETLSIEPANDAGALAIEAGAVDAMRTATGRWLVNAPPAPGIYELVVVRGPDRILLNLFVLTPASEIKNDRLNGYRIGRYPARPLYGDPAYLPPDGYIELTEANAGTRVSPHFTLGQFPSKQASGYPKYLVLREGLLLKLELLLEHVNAQGVASDTFTVMSGYRTPYYNAAIGNVPSSRHVYGGAADIYIDVDPPDGDMDDINADGAVNFRDAQLLYRWANSLFARPEHAALVGGLGVYRRNAAHGPFLHVDARGRRARWGLIP